MARLQILELPEGSGDDRPPFILVVDQHQPLRYIQAPGYEPTPVDEFAGIAEQIGARTVLVFQESVEIPANAAPVEVNDAEQAGTTQIVYAHERTRLDLCNALLLSGDTTWRQLVEQAAERQKAVAELYRQRDEIDPKLVALVRRTLGIEMTPGGIPVEEVMFNACRELEKSEAAREHLREERAEARQWARHGYEIGQRHCSWSDHGVAPGWLTEGWPRSFDSCEHLQQAAAFDEALTRVRNLSTTPEIMNAEQEHPGVWRHGYECGIRAAKSAARPRDEKASGS